LTSTAETEMFSSADDRSASAPTNMASEVDRHLHDVGVAALAAVAQFPRAVNNQSDSFIVSEVVNAVTSAGSPPEPRILNSGFSLLSGRRGSHQQAGTGASAGPEFVFGSSLGGGDVNVETIIENFIQRTEARQNVAFATNSGYEDCQKDIIMDYESATMEDAASPLQTSDDELEDFLQFYPDEEEYYYRLKKRPAPDAEMADYDLDDFYNSINYEELEMDLPQTLGVSMADPFENHFADPLELPGPHPASIIHTSSKML
jgi:hypothetical protein